MWPLSATAQGVLTTTHAVTIRATAYTSALGIVSNLPVSSGSISIDATSQTRRSGTVGIGDPGYWPDDPLSILSPLGSELGIEYGIVLPGAGVEWVPVFRGPITDVARNRPYSSGDALTVTVADRSQLVADARFEQPTQTVAGATTVAEIRRLITDVLPKVTVTDLTGSAQVAAQLDIEQERWSDGVEALSTAIGAETFCDPFGNFVIRPTPVLTNPVASVITSGPGGVLVSKSDTQTRSLTYNEVVASGQRTDGTPPVYAIVQDTDPTSPTYIGGPFGRKPRFYASPLLTTAAQCQTAAASLLARTHGMHANVTMTTIVNPALDAGDVITVVQGDVVTTHIVDTVSVPLTLGDAQQIATRSLDLPAES